MKIGISTAGYYPEMNTEDVVELYGKNGIKTVEIFLNTLSEMEPDFCLKLRETLEKYGMECNSVHSISAIVEPFLFDKYKRRNDDHIEIFKKTLNAIEILGSNIYTFHGPSIYSLTDPDYRHMAKCYDRLYDIAGEKGITVAQENMRYIVTQQPRYFESVMEHMRNTMKFTLDIKQARKSGLYLCQMLDIMGENIVNLHLSDGDEEHLCLMPGEGEFDFTCFLKDMEEKGYKGNGIMEIYRNNFDGVGDLKSGIEYLERCLK